jgi:hypothetical protein
MGDWIDGTADHPRSLKVDFFGVLLSLASQTRCRCGLLTVCTLTSQFPSQDQSRVVLVCQTGWVCVLWYMQGVERGQGGFVKVVFMKC